jgi:hypothetical protein
MKKRKQFWMIAIITTMLLLFGFSASAADWYTCTVVNVGVNDVGPAVRLTDTAGAFTKNWFRLAGSDAKFLLATALTALSLGKNVWVKAEGAAAFDNVTIIYIAN